MHSIKLSHFIISLKHPKSRYYKIGIIPHRMICVLSIPKKVNYTEFIFY